MLVFLRLTSEKLQSSWASHNSEHSIGERIFRMIETMFLDPSSFVCSKQTEMKCGVVWIVLILLVLDFLRIMITRHLIQILLLPQYFGPTTLVSLNNLFPSDLFNRHSLVSISYTKKLHSKLYWQCLWHSSAPCDKIEWFEFCMFWPSIYLCSSKQLGTEIYLL